jgi:hypothetical protein
LVIIIIWIVGLIFWSWPVTVPGKVEAASLIILSVAAGMAISNLRRSK